MSPQKKIKLYLTQNELSNRWLSTKLGISEQTLSRILKERTFLKLDMYVAITNILGVPVDYFLVSHENITPPQDIELDGYKQQVMSEVEQ